jgi:hypothetical protein
MVDRSRPLRATDSLLHNDASPDDDTTTFADPARIATPKNALNTLGTDIDTFLGTLTPLLTDPVANRATLIAGVDGFIDSAVALLQRAATFALPSSGWGFALDWKHTAFTDLMAQTAALAKRWQDQLNHYDTSIAAYDLLPAATPDDVRFQALQAAELDIVAQLDPVPATPALLRTALNGKRAAFNTALGQAQAILLSGGTSFATVLANATAIPAAVLDQQAFDLAGFGDRAVTIAGDIAANLAGHRAAITTRVAAVQQQLDAAAAAATATAQVEALQAAAKALFGPDFVIYPEFTVSAAQGGEWMNALAYSVGGALLNYTKTTAKIDLPVDEWLYGVARVRQNMRSWEQMLMLTGAFGVAQPELIPVQLPFESGPSWYAHPYDPAFPLETDHLLYTAYYTLAFDPTKRQCGILLDEWTEVIPATTRNTGITFNFNRPDNEAPQAFLLVTPATANGAWRWDDLIGALNETLDLAKMRAVEPVHLDSTAYARFLPATVMAATLYGISITTALAASNGVYRAIGAPPHA